MQTIPATIILRPADFCDVFFSAQKKRIGQPFWLKSLETGKFDNKAYLVSELTNSQELKGWVENKMVYVPASDIDIQAEKRQSAA